MGLPTAVEKILAAATEVDIERIIVGPSPDDKGRISMETLDRLHFALKDYRREIIGE